MNIKIMIALIFASVFSLNAESPEVIHCQSIEEVEAVYYQQVNQHPEHISIVTGQSSGFLAFEICMRAIFERFHKHALSSDQLNNLFFLRYPRLDAPHDVQDLFKKFPLVNRKGALWEYDSFDEVAKYLISASPDLQETVLFESAKSFFLNSTRRCELRFYLSLLLRELGVADSLFLRQRVDDLCTSAPESGTVGILTQIVIPKSSPLDRALYLSYAYGIPYCRDKYYDIGALEELPEQPVILEDPLAFFLQFEKGEWKHEVPQIRFLPSALLDTEHFPPGEVKMIRYTLVPKDQLDEFRLKVEAFVEQLWEVHQVSARELEERLKVLEAMEDGEAREAEYALEARKCMERFDPWSAFLYSEKLSDGPVRISLLKYILQGFVSMGAFENAEAILEQEEELAKDDDVLFALTTAYLEWGHREGVESLIKKLTSEDLKEKAVKRYRKCYPVTARF